METHAITPRQRELDSPFKLQVILGSPARAAIHRRKPACFGTQHPRALSEGPLGDIPGGAYMDDPYSSTKLGCFTSVPPEIIEQRLATALNTITMSSYEVNVLTGGKGAPSTYNFYALVLWQNTTATWTEFDTGIYELDKPWFVTTIMSTAILFICAIANIVIRQRIKAPNFLDSLAGLTRDSPFIDVPQDGSGKSGSDRLETVKSVKVRIPDVSPDEEVGKIA
ncbi:hypothetical protein HZ326_17289 [Fusarium oxysporum f. sp. albedinis]|nr:hypothetical protein HZ326_17289 [Fusarium oxysporum f. sp. albedinis]